jgi:2-polyprenyl-3-methyl-5-hydroxy-6-metoxy-1,4-benzoquinol methylase
MQTELLKFLTCPIEKTDLKFVLISEFKKEYSTQKINEVKEGLLFSQMGFIFPIIDGIPRILLEAIYDYSDFIKKHFDGYEKTKKQLELKYKGLLDYCLNKNKRTKKSFEFEWSFLNQEKKDQIWNNDISELSKIFLRETGCDESYFSDKTVVDIGCGHGVMTSKISEISKCAIGIELSKSIENAYILNKNINAMYIQGDLQFLAFKFSSFDVLYSSGVIHHTNNTELSLSLIEPILKENGKICLWLYHPRKSIIHNLIDRCRKFTSILPIKLTFILLVIFILPFTLLIKYFKRKKAPNFREEIIDLLDSFTPEFRHETEQDLATIWLQRRNYKNIKIATESQFGYSIIGEKGNYC